VTLHGRCGTDNALAAERFEFGWRALSPISLGTHARRIIALAISHSIVVFSPEETLALNGHKPCCGAAAMPLEPHSRTSLILLTCALASLPIFIGLPAPSRGDSAGWRAVILTQSYRPKRGFVSDGSTLYSAELVGKTYQLFQTTVPNLETAESKPLSTAFKDVYLSDLSPDGMQRWVRSIRQHSARRCGWRC